MNLSDLKSLKALAGKTPQEVLDLLGPERVLAMEGWAIEYGRVQAAKTFDLAGFKAWFHLVTGGPLHPEGERWAEAIFEAIESCDLKVLIEAFRGSGKTTVVIKMFFAFFLGHHPHTTNGLVRINDTKANETAKEIADLIDRDERWKMVFPNVVPDKDRGWGEKNGYFLKRSDVKEGDWAKLQAESKRPTGPTFIGYGWASGSVIGSRWNGLMLVDDIHDRENTRSDRQMKEVRGFVTDTLLPIAVPGETLEIWTFTPWQPNDAYAFRKETGRYLHVKSPVMRQVGENEGTYWELDPEIPLSGKWYELSWPERWGFREIGEKYIDMKMENAADFARMYMLDLEAVKGLNLKTEWLHEYPASEINPTWPVFFGIDYASTADKLKNRDSDYFTLAILAAIPGGGLVLKDGARRRLSKGEALDLVATYAGMYPTLQKVGVETHGSGKDFYHDLVYNTDAFPNPLPLVPIQHGKQSKGDRFEGWLAPRFRVSRIWITDAPNEFVQAFRDEWMMWPNAAHDDTLDGVYMAARVAEGYIPSKAERSFGKKRNVAGREIRQALARI